jgi:hypothetical protein
MPIQPSVRRTLLSILSITAAAACYDAATSPTVPQSAPATMTTIQATSSAGNSSAIGSNSQSGGNTQVAQCDPRPALVSRGVFGPAGGTLVIGDSRLIIPAGALSVSVPITASTPGDSTSEVDFKPHGLKFSMSATLVLAAGGCNVSENLPPRIVYIGPNGRVRETISATRDAQDNVIAPIAHFSGYAIAF